MGKQQATTSPVKKSKLQRWRRRFIILAGILAGLWLVNFLTWVPAYLEVWDMSRDPMAEKGILGLELKSSSEKHRIPPERSFLGKGTYPSVNRYYEMPKNESVDSLLKKLRQQAEGFGWKMDKERSGTDYFVGYKNIGSREYSLQVSIILDDEYNNGVHVIIKGLGK